MGWMEQLGKENRGSRPRCVLLCDGAADQVARRLTELVGRPGEVSVSATDQWHPRGTVCVEEAQLDKAPALLDDARQRRLREWWLAKGSEESPTPSWDIASTCKIFGKAGLLLIEAKAHSSELSPKDRCRAKSSRDSINNAIRAANDGLRCATGGSWQLCTAQKYQLSNRFAWSWKLATLGKPVVLVYLGFLNAEEMKGEGTTLFRSDEDWKDRLQEYGQGTIDSDCWEKALDIGGTTLLPLIRTTRVELCKPQC